MRPLLLIGRLLALLAWTTVPLTVDHRPAEAATDPCPPGFQWDSLCNVEPELQRSYLLLERLTELADYGEPISALVRERRVTIRWDWDDTDRAHLGSFDPLTNEVLLPAHVRGEPDRVEATILAHELWHAYNSSQGWYRAANRANCLQDERSAFSTGVVYYSRFLAMAGADPSPRSAVDSLLVRLDQDWRGRGGTAAALDAVANEHLVRDGYLQRCMRYPSWQAALPGWLSSTPEDAHAHCACQCHLCGRPAAAYSGE